MSETRLICRVCEGVFSEHEVLCPKCGSARMELYPFGPDAPVEELVEKEEA